MSDDLAEVLGSQAQYRGKSVIRMRVDASATPPVRLDGRVYVRPGPTTRLGTREDERVLAEKRRSLDGPFDIRPLLGASLSDLDLDLFRSAVLPAFVAPEVIEENGRSVEQQLASLRVTDIQSIPTVLGVLLVGLDPTSYIPGGYIQFIRYSGIDVGAAIVDAQEIRNNMIDATAVMENVLRGHLHTPVRSSGGFREETQPEFPLDALREIFINALIHRNYETSYAPIRVAWFDDRIEVTNPGGPFGQVRVDNFARVNDYRNPSLAGAMKALGYANRFGRGIGRIQSALRRNGNPEADFIVDDSSWTVVVRRAA